jgi:platelet-activating factor acetylhydrolase
MWMTIPCFSDAPVARNSNCNSGLWPVVIFSHGLYGTLEMYSTLCMQIASFGYIVIAMEHEDGSAIYAKPPDSKPLFLTRVPKGLVYKHRNEVQDFRRPMLDKRVQDVAAILAALQAKGTKTGTGREAGDGALLASLINSVDDNRVHLMGHSFGGAATLQASLHFQGSPSSSSLPSTVKSRVVLDNW